MVIYPFRPVYEARLTPETRWPLRCIIKMTQIGTALTASPSLTGPIRSLHGVRIQVARWSPTLAKKRFRTSKVFFLGNISSNGTIGAIDEYSGFRICGLLHELSAC